MDLEDARDGQAQKLAGLEKLLAATQAIAGRKPEEAAHLAQVRAGLSFWCGVGAILHLAIL